MFPSSGVVHFDCAAYWVNDRQLLYDALDVTPEFLRTKQGDAGLFWILLARQRRTQILFRQALQWTIAIFSLA